MPRWEGHPSMTSRASSETREGDLRLLARQWIPLSKANPWDTLAAGPASSEAVPSSDDGAE